MGSVRVRPQSGTLYFDFRYRGTRCREQTLLKDTAANRRKMAQVLEKIEAEITLGTFNYRGYFPNSPTADRFDAMARGAVPTDAVPDFATFSDDWFDECRVSWKTSYAENVRITLKAHLVPHFGKLSVNRVSKADILKFRASLAKVTSRSKKPLSSDRINHIMTPLRMILREAADRFHFTDPWQGIKPLKVPRTEVDPFTLEELERFLAAVRPDYRDYYITRFFTGLRTAEIDGLKWRYVDLERRVILVSDTWVNGREETPKTPGSVRHVELSSPVVVALERQQKLTGKGDYVFCNREGKPLDRRNVMRRIWFPTLDLLGLRRRRPYQTRHTAATLWLACGESPEWIARQMGHANTQMLFRVYSRSNLFQTLQTSRRRAGFLLCAQTVRKAISEKRVVSVLVTTILNRHSATSRPDMTAFSVSG